MEKQDKNAKNGKGKEIKEKTKIIPRWLLLFESGLFVRSGSVFLCSRVPLVGWMTRATMEAVQHLSSVTVSEGRGFLTPNRRNSLFFCTIFIACLGHETVHRIRLNGSPFFSKSVIG